VRVVRFIVLIALVVATACNGSPEDVLGGECSQGETIESDSGLVFEDLRCGDGQEAGHGDALTVDYVGRLADGTVFDASAPERPLELLLDSDLVIAGWSEGLEGMQEGGRRRLVVPPALAYGEEGLADEIPPNETVTYEVELIEVRSRD
jgi:FKBP-type peptidyl-prolyl cis-trans isomerase FkpA